MRCLASFQSRWQTKFSLDSLAPICRMFVTSADSLLASLSEPVRSTVSTKLRPGCKTTDQYAHVHSMICFHLSFIFCSNCACLEGLYTFINRSSGQMQSSKLLTLNAPAPASSRHSTCLDRRRHGLSNNNQYIYVLGGVADGGLKLVPALITRCFCSSSERTQMALDSQYRPFDSSTWGSKGTSGKLSSSSVVSSVSELRVDRLVRNFRS